MNNLVRKTMVRIICDTYTCRNLAEFEIGHEVNPQFCSHYCRDCMESIAKESSKMMFGDMVMEEPETEPEKEQEPEKEPEQEETKEETAEEEKVEYYICKYCGEKFVKPAQLSEYRSHVMKCQRS